MAPSVEFVDQVADAFEHLYDIVYLRTHALAALVSEGDGQTRKERAWELHHLLINTVGSLNPGDDAPTASREWRRHRLLQLRYVDAREIAAVCQDLAMSRRTYYRELRDALEAAAELLQDSEKRLPNGLPPNGGSETRLELIRLEAARASQTRRFISLHAVLTDAFELIQELAEHLACAVTVRWETLSHDVLCDQVLMRQILLSLVSDLVASGPASRLEIEGHQTASHAEIILTVDRPSPVHELPQGDALKQGVKVLYELARPHGIDIRPAPRHGGGICYVVSVPVETGRTVLVVDDNDDTLRLLQRFLAAGGYKPLSTNNGTEAIQMAERIRPAAIILDVMMPDQDGWDIMQTLLNSPSTRHIPVLICTVLAAKTLALSLGAAAFLSKPVSEGTLLRTLQQVLPKQRPTQPGGAE